MNYLLDTTVIIDMLHKNKGVLEFLKNHTEDKFLTSSICEAEIWEGVYREDNQNFEKSKKIVEELLKSLSNIITFDSNQAQVAGQIRSALSARGELTGDLDILIAASAIANDATILTKNVKHFNRIKNLQVISL